jgi:hypothetical protein
MIRETEIAIVAAVVDLLERTDTAFTVGLLVAAAKTAGEGAIEVAATGVAVGAGDLAVAGVGAVV